MGTIKEPSTEDQPQGAEAAVSHEDSRRYLARNTIAQVLYFIFSAVTSMYFVPYQIKHLGIANYGMVTLATQVVWWLQVATISIVGTISRFVTLQYANNNLKQARSYLTTQFVAVASFATILLPVGIGVSFLAPHFFVVPRGQEMNTTILFIFTYVTFMTTLFISTFQVGTFIKQRFDVRNMLDAFNQAVSYASWIIMFAVLSPSLWQIGLGRAIGAAATLIGTIIAFRKFTPQLRPSLRGFDLGKFKEMLKMGGWMTVAQVGMILYVSFDAVLINKTLGPDSVGKYGSVAGLSVMVRSLSGMMLSIIGPPALACVAREDWSGLSRIITRASKFISLGMAVLLGIICGLSTPFVVWWLGPQFKSLDILIWLMFSHLVLNLGVEPLYSVTYAANKMAAPGVATIIGGFIKIGLAIVLIKYSGWGLYGVAVADMISLAVKNLIFAPMYVSRIMKSSPVPVYMSVLPSAVVFAIVSVTALGVSKLCSSPTFFALAGSGMLLVLVFGLLTYFVFLTSDDRGFLRRAISR